VRDNTVIGALDVSLADASAQTHIDWLSAVVDVVRGTDNGLTCTHKEEDMSKLDVCVARNKLQYHDIQKNWWKIRPHLADKELNEILVRDFNKYTWGRWRQKFLPGNYPDDFESCDWRWDQGRRGPCPAFWRFSPTLSVYQNILDAIATHRVGDRPDRYEPRASKLRRDHYDWLAMPSSDETQYGKRG
jgi:hypothetical protein